jgi:hypothetical protein
MTSSIAFAAENGPLGGGALAVKVDYITFTEDEFDDFDVESGSYVGLEAFGEVAPSVYVGFEIGWANSDGDVTILGTNVDTEVIYVPIELNLKYAVELAPMFIIDFGAGLSYNFAYVEYEEPDFDDDEDDWLLGGQFFVDLNYVFDPLFVGVNGKYQITEETDDFDISFDNWRIGGQIGIVF